MNPNDVFLEPRPPSTAAYCRLHEAVGWGPVNTVAFETGRDNTLYWVTAVSAGEEIGCGRVIGDGGLYFYVQDIMVMPAWQGRGLGRRMMEAIMAYLRAQAPDGSWAGLMAARNVASFYYQFGFAERPADSPGMFQVLRKTRARPE